MVATEKPVMADTQPRVVELEAGKSYYWCACGKSGQQPFCDGSHKDGPFIPRKFTAEKTGQAYLCLCKRTKNPPYCDGSHKSAR